MHEKFKEKYLLQSDKSFYVCSSKTQKVGHNLTSNKSQHDLFPNFERFFSRFISAIASCFKLCESDKFMQSKW